LKDIIYHLVTESEFQAQVKGNEYTPARFDHDGFIHCTSEPSALLAVANDYFSAVKEPVLVLIIEPDKLVPEVRFEAPEPIAGGGTSHLEHDLLFPHIYGPLNLDAVIEMGVLRKSDGMYQWPDHFTTKEQKSP
jgi:uncharacterized protein (DUF952 family)